MFSTIGKKVAVLGVLLGLLTTSSQAWGQNSEIEGVWSGVLDVKVAKLRLQLDIEKSKDGLQGKMISLDQGGAEIKFDSLSMENRTVEFQIAASQIKYKGELSDDGTTIKGVFSQLGNKYELSFEKTGKSAKLELVEVWTGKMNAGARTFDFQFRLLANSEGDRTVKLDSFSEKITIAGELIEDDNKVTITIPVTKAVFEGTKNEAGDTIEGKWKQNNVELPLTIKKVPNNSVRAFSQKRPQTPKGPFDYVVEEFKIKVSEIDAKYDAATEIAGTVTAPKGTGKHPALILISGSGPQDRDETLFGHKPFLVLADYLTQRGYVVIRYDERGVGESTGDYGNSTTSIFAEDVEAIYRWAKRHPRVAPNQIVLCGHSEGGLVAPMVASRNEGVAGVIMLAGPGVTGKEIILNQSRKISAVSGADDKSLDQQEQVLELVLSRIISDEPLDEEFKQKIVAIADEDDEGAFGEMFDRLKVQMSSPWMKFFLKHDPGPSLAKTQCPVLAIVGAKDLQVDPELNNPAINANLEKGKNKDVTIEVLPGLNHLFQECETGSPAEYQAIEQTLSQSMLEKVASWLDQRFK